MIWAFIAPARRARWLESLAAANRRSRFLGRLNHCRDIDERYATPLAEAVAKAESGGWGTLINCLPGRLAYYYHECGERRMLLKRDVSSPNAAGIAKP